MNVERISAPDAERLQRRVAGALRARGIRPGDRVVFSRPNSAALLVAMLGALRSGVVAVPLNPTLLDHERTFLVDDAQPALVVDRDDVLASLLADDRPDADLAPVPLARPMHYTSGTTGRPKGVWSGVLSEADAAALFDEEATLWGFDAGETNLVCSPLYHSAPLRFATGTLLRGGDVVVLPKFDAALAAATIAEHRPTNAFVVPAHLQRLFVLDELPSLSSFRLLAHAGAPCPAPLKRMTIERFGADVVWEFYGSTEGQFTACSSPEWVERPGTVGRARPGRRLSTDPDGTIWCDVPRHARFEYWRDTDRTAQAWRGDAFSVGDLGRLDDAGYLYLDGRRDDLVISGGVNVYPLEVEQALVGFPGVTEVAVFGVPDDRWGFRVCAAVVGDVDPDTLLAYARERLAPYKRPKDVYLVDELPRTGTGKIRRSRIAAALGLDGDTGGEAAVR